MVTQDYRFTPDEMRVIKECESEAVYKRCIPFGFTAGMTAYLAVQRGFLRVIIYFAAIKLIQMLYLYLLNP